MSKNEAAWAGIIHIVAAFVSVTCMVFGLPTIVFGIAVTGIMSFWGLLLLLHSVDEDNSHVKGICKADHYIKLSATNSNNMDQVISSQLMSCEGRPDPRCGSGWCTEHCREKCKYECLPDAVRVDIEAFMGANAQMNAIRETRKLRA